MGTSSHLKSLLKKNFLLWKRNKIGSLLEILIPIAFAFLFLAFRYAEPVQDVAQTSYYTSPAYLPPKYAVWMKKCGGDKIGLAPKGDTIVKSLETMFKGMRILFISQKVIFTIFKKDLENLYKCLKIMKRLMILRKK